MGTMSEFLQYARLKEHPGKRPPGARMVAHLLDDHEAIARTLRGDLEVCAEEFNDTVTSSFLNGLLEQHESMARILRAYLENS
jgi:starvation-inducible DNA-binding protein